MNFEEAKRSDPFEEKTTSSEKTTNSTESNLGESKEIVFFESSEESEILYNDEFGDKMPWNEGGVVSLTAPNLSAINFGELHLFRSTIRDEKVRELLRAYPFCR